MDIENYNSMFDIAIKLYSTFKKEKIKMVGEIIYKNF